MGKIINIAEYLANKKIYTNDDISSAVAKLNSYSIKLESLLADKTYSKNADEALMDFHMSILENYFSILIKLIEDEKNPLYNESVKDLENLVKSLTPIDDIKEQSK